jgi:hypothetical protein
LDLRREIQMAYVRFNFNKDFPREDQEKILAAMNSKESWRPIEEAGRLHPDSDDPELYRQCYFKFTEARSSKGRRSEVLTQYLFTMNNVRKQQYERAWIVEPEPDTGEREVHPKIWQA